MNKELNAVIRPHSPSPLRGCPNKDRSEVDPVGIDSIVDVQVWFDPVAVHVAGIRFLGAKTAVNINLLDPCIPKHLHGETQSLAEPSPPSRETEAPSDLLERRLMIAGR